MSKPFMMVMAALDGKRVGRWPAINIKRRNAVRKHSKKTFLEDENQYSSSGAGLV
jgi:hypothetical protein